MKRLLLVILTFASTAFAQIGPIVSPGRSASSDASKTALTADTNFYVRTDGSNANSGLVNSAGGAWLTLQGAWDNITNNYRAEGYTATINIADGTYVGNLALGNPQAMTGKVNFLGNTGTPANVVLNATGKAVGIVITPDVALVTISGLTVSNATIGIAGVGGNIKLVDVSIANAPAYSLFISAGTYATATDLTVSGDADNAFYIADSTLETLGVLTVSGTPAYTEFIHMAGGIMVISGTVVNGGATGARFGVNYGAQLIVGSNAIPGNTAGATDSGTGSAVTGDAPALSACGTTPAIGGNDMVGRVTTGTGAALQSCTMTFANPTIAAPVCFVNNETSILLVRATASATALVLDSAVAGTLQSKVLTYKCSH